MRIGDNTELILRQALSESELTDLGLLNFLTLPEPPKCLKRKSFRNLQILAIFTYTLEWSSFFALSLSYYRSPEAEPSSYIYWTLIALLTFLHTVEYFTIHRLSPLDPLHPKSLCDLFAFILGIMYNISLSLDTLFVIKTLKIIPNSFSVVVIPIYTFSTLLVFGLVGLRLLISTFLRNDTWNLDVFYLWREFFFLSPKNVDGYLTHLSASFSVGIRRFFKWTRTQGKKLYRATRKCLVNVMKKILISKKTEGRNIRSSAVEYSNVTSQTLTGNGLENPLINSEEPENNEDSSKHANPYLMDEFQWVSPVIPDSHLISANGEKKKEKKSVWSNVLERLIEEENQEDNRFERLPHHYDDQEDPSSSVSSEEEVEIPEKRIDPQTMMQMNLFFQNYTPFTQICNLTALNFCISFGGLHSVLKRVYVPMYLQERLDFSIVMQSLCRYLLQDTIFIVLKVLLLMSYGYSGVIALSLTVSLLLSFLNCIYNGASFEEATSLIV